MKITLIKMGLISIFWLFKDRLKIRGRTSLKTGEWAGGGGGGVDFQSIGGRGGFPEYS